MKILGLYVLQLLKNVLIQNVLGGKLENGVNVILLDVLNNGQHYKEEK